MQSMITSCHLALPRDQPSLAVPRVDSSNRMIRPITRHTKVIRRGIKSVVLAHQGDDMDCHGFGNGRLVDEDIITLRLRMKELMSRSECEDELPLEWMEWERNYFGFGYFEKDVYALVGWLQMALMNTRPCLAVGMVALLAFSIMTSVALLSLHGIQVCKGIVNGLILN